MNYTIEISEEVEERDMPDLLRHIAGQLDEGYSSGYQPTWRLVEVGPQVPSLIPQRNTIDFWSLP